MHLEIDELYYIIYFDIYYYSKYYLIVRLKAYFCFFGRYHFLFFVGNTDIIKKLQNSSKDLDFNDSISKENFLNNKLYDKKNEDTDNNNLELTLEIFADKRKLKSVLYNT